jgi:transposase
VEGGFITNITVTPGNVFDSEPVAENTAEMVTKAGLKPEKMIGDGAYGTGDNRQQLKEMGIFLVAPHHPQTISEDLPKEACRACELKDACTKNKNGRTISVNKHYQVQMEALEYSKTEEYKLEIKKRCPIEGTGAELVYHHGLRRARYWGRLKS